MISNGKFSVQEFEGERNGVTDQIVASFCSRPMCLRDASRFAAALSYARGAYVEVVPEAYGDYHEWWYAGSIWRESLVPAVRRLAVRAGPKGYSHALPRVPSRERRHA
jgi:hypothetical protein